MGFCNTYFSVDDAVSQLSDAGAMIDFFDLAPLHVERTAISLRARTGLKQDVLIGARGPRRVRRGRQRRRDRQRREEDPAAYRPCHSGARFSANARTPS